jgi:hypothetical protein
MRFTFIKEPDDTYFEEGQANFGMEFEAQTLPDILTNFEDFLRGCGFRFDGVLDFVDDEERVGTNWWKGDPTCGGIAENYMAKESE